MGGDFDGAARHEKRCRHDVECPSMFTGNCEATRHVGRFHIAEFHADFAEMGADLLDLNTRFIADTGRIHGCNGENDVFLVQKLHGLEDLEKPVANLQPSAFISGLCCISPIVLEILWNLCSHSCVSHGGPN